MIILVTGWRHHPDMSEIHRRLTDLYNARRGQLTVVHGACPTGADRYTDMWCNAYGIHADRFPARDHGPWPGCGPRRNKVMVAWFAAHPDLLKHALAFPQPDWETASVCGTRGCIRELREAGIVPTIYPWEG